jgi:acetyltransferase-like isoleucine patch superfamily enzyme
VRVIHNGFLYKFFGVLRYFLLKVYYGKKFKATSIGLIASYCDFVIEGPGEIHFGDRVLVGRYVQIYSKGSLTIGARVTINEYSRIIAHDNIRIGNDVIIAKFVSILDHDHHFSLRDGRLIFDDFDSAAVVIGDNVWIGDKVTILKGVKIGNNVVIASNCVVNGDVPSGYVVGGVPYKLIKKIQPS